VRRGSPFEPPLILSLGVQREPGFEDPAPASVDRGADLTYSKDQFTIGKTGNAPPSLMIFTIPIWTPFRVRA
jgi:hypothetical protein